MLIMHILVNKKYIQEKKKKKKKVKGKECV